MRTCVVLAKHFAGACACNEAVMLLLGVRSVCLAVHIVPNRNEHGTVHGHGHGAA
jgi:hypothetical protein